MILNYAASFSMVFLLVGGAVYALNGTLRPPWGRTMYQRYFLGWWLGSSGFLASQLFACGWWLTPSQVPEFLLWQAAAMTVSALGLVGCFLAISALGLVWRLTSLVLRPR